MRADRLISLLMLLQTRGRLTAGRLAEELEVSERTIYRDVEALSIAGVPVYAERGPGGGIALLDPYRTNLTGLSAGEARALFMLSIPSALADLGVGQDLKAALLKLAAALPAGRRQDEAWARQHIYLDPDPWSRDREPRPHLQTIHQAVCQEESLEIRYQPRFGTRLEQRVDPYGLVAKGDSWHLVAAKAGSLRVYTLENLLEVRPSGERFERPPGFDLPAFWSAWCAAQAGEPPDYVVTIRASPELAPHLPRAFGRRAGEAAGPPDAEGWVRLQLTFDSLVEARTRLLAFGRAIEVIAPEPLRLSVLDFARQITALYAGSRAN